MITYSITLCLEKEIIILEKVWKKSLRTLYDTFSHDTIRHCNLAFIRLRNFEAKLFPSFWFLSSTSNLCLFEEVLFTGFESQDVTCLPMIAQASTLDFQQTYNITLMRLLSRLGWFLHRLTCFARDFSKSYIAVSLAFPYSSQVRTLRVARLVTTTETLTSSRNQKRRSLRHARQPHPRPSTRAQTLDSTGRQMGILYGVLNLWDVGTLTGKGIHSVAPSFMSSIFGPKRRSFTPYRNNQRQTSDSSWKFLNIENVRIKTVQSNSRG